MKFIYQKISQKISQKIAAFLVWDSVQKLWNIAIQYGSKSPIIKPLTEEQGNFDIEFF